MHAPTTPGRVIAIGAALIVAAIIVAQLPIVFGLALLISALARRPLLAAALRRWPDPPRTAAAPGPGRLRSAATRLTVVWGIVLVVVGLVQGIGAVVAGLSITNPASLAIRTLFAMAVMALTAAATVRYLRAR